MKKTPPSFTTLLFILLIGGTAINCSAQRWGAYLGSGLLMRLETSKTTGAVYNAIMPSPAPIFSPQIFYHRINKERHNQLGYLQFGFLAYLPVKKLYSEYIPASHYPNNAFQNNCYVRTTGLYLEARSSIYTVNLENPLYTMYFGIAGGGGVYYTETSDTLVSYFGTIHYNKLIPGKFYGGGSFLTVFSTLIYESEWLRYQLMVECGGLGAAMGDKQITGFNFRFGVMLPFRREKIMNE